MTINSPVYTQNFDTKDIIPGRFSWATGVLELSKTILSRDLTIEKFGVATIIITGSCGSEYVVVVKKLVK